MISTADWPLLGGYINTVCSCQIMPPEVEHGINFLAVFQGDIRKHGGNPALCCSVYLRFAAEKTYYLSKQFLCIPQR